MNLEWKVNSLKSEIDFFNRTFTSEKIEQFDNTGKELEQLGVDMVVLETKLASCARMTDVDEFYSVVAQKYASKHKVQSLEEKIDDFVGREEFSIL